MASKPFLDEYKGLRGINTPDENELYIEKLMGDFANDLSSIIPEAQTLTKEKIGDLWDSITGSDIAELGKDLFSPAGEIEKKRAIEEARVQKDKLTKEANLTAPNVPTVSQSPSNTPYPILENVNRTLPQEVNASVQGNNNIQKAQQKNDLMSMYKQLMQEGGGDTKKKEANLSDLIGKWANILNRSSLNYKGGTGAAIGQGVAGYKNEQDLLEKSQQKGRESQVDKFMDLYTKQKKIDVDSNRNLPEIAKMIEYLKTQAPGLKYSDYAQMAKQISSDGGGDGVKQFMNAYKMTDELSTPQERSIQAKEILASARGGRASPTGIKRFNPDTGVIE